MITTKYGLKVLLPGIKNSIAKSAEQRHRQASLITCKLVSHYKITILAYFRIFQS